MTCRPTCPTPTPAQAHCPGCHRTFGGAWGFEQHRKDGACLDPGERGFQQVNGVWRQRTDRPQPAHWRSGPPDQQGAPTHEL